MKAFEKFLYLCGTSARNEENLFSDFVKHMCDVNQYFLNLLFRLCFPSAESEVIPVYIIREVYIADDSRIDFAVQTKGHGVYYIENKIADDNVVENAKKYIGHLKEKYGEEANKHLAYILPYKNYKTEPNQLIEIGINCVPWEGLIDKCLENDKFHEFTLILSSIIQYYSNSIFLTPPNEEELQVFKEKCDKLYTRFLLSTATYGKIDEWKKGRFYGYNFCDNLHFGINFCPINGLFFCFTYDYTDYKNLITNKNRKINYQMEFKYLKPLGKYHNDKDIYLEILKENNDDISEDRFEDAFKELGQYIQVIDKGKIIPIDKYIEYRKSN